jgi:hypothetical protein
MRIVALALLFASSLLAQEKPPFDWKVSGDSVETFKMELVSNVKVDQSSARACVLSYAAFTDNRETTTAMMKSVGEKWDAAVAKSLEKAEAELLTADAINGMRDLKPDAVPERKFQAVKVVGEKAEAGVTWLETTQAVEVPYKELGTGKVLMQKQEIRLRFACVKSGEKWRIRGIEQQVIDEEGTPKDGKAPTKWVADPGLLPVIIYALKQDADRATAPETNRESAEAAARSLFESLIVRRDMLTESVRAKGLSAWLEALKPFVTDEFYKAQEALAADWLKQKVAEPPREIEKVTDNADQSKIVRFKARDSYSGAVEIRVVREGESWKVHSGGYFALKRDSLERPVWEFTPEADLYALKWR